MGGVKPLNPKRSLSTTSLIRIANCNQTITSGKVGGRGGGLITKTVSGVASSLVCIQSQTKEQKMSDAWE